MRIYVKVMPHSGRNEIRQIAKNDYKAWVTAPPEKGKANQALISLLADFFQVAKSQIKITGGKTASRKIIDVLGK